MTFEKLKAELENTKLYFEYSDYTEIKRLISKTELQFNNQTYQKPLNVISEESKRHAEKLKNLGNLDFKKGNYDQAIILYTKAIELNPDCVFYSNRAASYAKLGKIDMVIADCQKSIDLDPAFVKPYLRLGLVFFDTDLEKSEYYFEKAKILEPENELCAAKLMEIKHKKESAKESNLENEDLISDSMIDNQFENILNNFEGKNLNNSISKIMSDPKMMEMAKNLMKDKSPEDIQNMLSSFLKK
ncbi:Small glutamine-rich tetratricopeptide repeat-containing protein alpha [Dictyocoela muelleri]|nr:Small glutamine-rich tetratricopeptide repeat-containing protein alpha [Dictyocoela muelleri]